MYCPVHKASSTMWYENLMILWVHQSVSIFKFLYVTQAPVKHYGNTGCGVFKRGLGGTKLERFLPKNQHTEKKLLNFEN